MLKPGDSFERYTIEAAIGQGGMGCVYRAHDARLGRRVALKVDRRAASGDEAERAPAPRGARRRRARPPERRRRSSTSASSMGRRYIVMELVPGRTLRSAIGGAGAPASTAGRLARRRRQRARGARTGAGSSTGTSSRRT